MGRAQWERNRRDDIEIVGLDRCLDLFVGSRPDAPGSAAEVAR
jgi:hypothetical protein